MHFEELEAPVLLASTQQGFSATNDIPKVTPKHEFDQEFDQENLEDEVNHTTDQEDTTTYHTEVYQLEDLFSEE